METNKYVAVNLGCGTQIAPNWINFDNSPNIYLSKLGPIKHFLYKLGFIKKAQYEAGFNSNIQFRELTKPLPFNDNSVDYVYSSHFLEHTSFEEAQKILAEIYRVLKPNGVARIVVPDLKWHIQQYLDNVKQTTRTTPFKNAADNFIFEIRMAAKSRDPHKWMYDEVSIFERMEDAKFKNINICKFREGSCIDVEILDNRPENSIHIEGIK